MTRLWRSAARFGVVLLCSTGLGFAAAAPAFAARGVTVRVTELPGGFTAGGQPQTMTVVATKDDGDCIKIRWSLAVQVAGVALEQVRVDRIEEDGSFPVNVQTEGGAARITDQRLDPGTLCDDRTVTARYNVNFTEETPSGQVRFTVAAFDTDERLLDQTTVSREVVGDATSSPSAEPEPPAAQAPGPVESQAGGVNPANASRSSAIRVLPIGGAVGAVMVVLGFVLLLRVRRRMRVRPAGRPGQREIWYGAAARRRTHPEDPTPVTAPIGAVATQRKVRRTLTLPPLRR